MVAIHDTAWHDLVADQLGTPVVQLNASGTPELVALKLPYGSGRYAAASLANLGFTGQRKDTSPNLTYFHARYYDQDVGVFLSPDSVRDGPNPYAYVGGMVENATDPSGQMQEDGNIGLQEVENAGPATLPDVPDVFTTASYDSTLDPETASPIDDTVTVGNTSYVPDATGEGITETTHTGEWGLTSVDLLPGETGYAAAAAALAAGLAPQPGDAPINSGSRPHKPQTPQTPKTPQPQPPATPHPTPPAPATSAGASGGGSPPNIPPGANSGCVCNPDEPWVPLYHGTIRPSVDNIRAGGVNRQFFTSRDWHVAWHFGWQAALENGLTSFSIVRVSVPQSVLDGLMSQGTAWQGDASTKEGIYWDQVVFESGSWGTLNQYGNSQGWPVENQDPEETC